MTGSMLKCLGTFTTFDRNNLKLLTQLEKLFVSFFSFFLFYPLSVGLSIPLAWSLLFIYTLFSYVLPNTIHGEYRSSLVLFVLSFGLEVCSGRDHVFHHIWIRRLSRDAPQATWLSVPRTQVTSGTIHVFSYKTMYSVCIFNCFYCPDVIEKNSKDSVCKSACIFGPVLRRSREAIKAVI